MRLYNLKIKPNGRSREQIDKIETGRLLTLIPGTTASINRKTILKSADCLKVIENYNQEINDSSGEHTNYGGSEFPVCR